jgi:hypothetical protein
MGPLRAQTWAHHGPKHGPIIGPKWIQNGPNGPQMGRFGAHVEPNMGPKGPKIGPYGTHVGPFWAQDVGGTNIDCRFA